MAMRVAFSRKIQSEKLVNYVMIFIILYYRVPNTGIVSAIMDTPDGHVLYYFHGFEWKNTTYISCSREILFHYCI